ncbi:MAG: glycosyltransferase family 39 protein [Candidatus Alcyoniella australis]|nr:glycosyltransferase family 39 protein [Candidatus Alcyoniella australis]
MLASEPWLVVLSAVWAALALILPTDARTLVDDSWNFALPVQQLLFHGRLYFDPFNSAAAVIHTLWGALFCLVFGFEPWVLRLSNVAATYLAAVGLYSMVRWSGRRGDEAFIAALVLSASPVLLVTGFTFQSDMVYLAMLCWSCALLVRAGTSGSRKALVWGAVIAALSIWNKLHGLLIAPLALPWFLANRRRLALPWPHLAMLVVLPLTSYAVFRLGYEWFHPVHTTLDAKWLQVQQRLAQRAPIIRDLAPRSALLLMHTGIVLLPLIVGLALGPRLERKTPWLWRSVIVGLAAFTAWWLLRIELDVIESGRYVLEKIETVWPYLPSMLTELPPLEWPWGFAHATQLALIGGALLAAMLASRLAKAIVDYKSPVGMLLLVLVGQLAVLYPLAQFFDRYFIGPTALLIAIVLIGSRRRLSIFSPGWLLLIPLLVIGGIRSTQYLRMHEALWDQAAVLERRGVDPMQIDAGYGYCGLHNYLPSLEHPDLKRAREEDAWYVKGLFLAMDVQYVVSWGPANQRYFEIESVSDEPAYDGLGVLDPKHVVVSRRTAYGPPAEPLNPRLPPE